MLGLQNAGEAKLLLMMSCIHLLYKRKGERRREVEEGVVEENGLIKHKIVPQTTGEDGMGLGTSRPLQAMPPVTLAPYPSPSTPCLQRTFQPAKLELV